MESPPHLLRGGGMSTRGATIDVARRALGKVEMVGEQPWEDVLVGRGGA